MIKRTGLIFLTAAISIHAQDALFTNVRRANRKTNVKVVRATTANQRAQQTLQTQLTNGDEQRYADKRGSYGKGLKQNDDGFVNVTAFKQLVIATQTGLPADFNKITMGTSPVERRLHSPQAGLDINLIGADGWINSIPAPPTLASAEKAGEMVEVYWQALLRNVNFIDYDTDLDVPVAIADLNNLSDFKGPKENGLVTVQTLFREDIPGALVGPYVSQFLFKDILFNDTFITQLYTVPTAANTNEFMTTFAEWFFIQQGHNPIRTITFDGTPRYIRNAHDLGNYVHKDPPQLPYLFALLILLSFGTEALDPSNPYINNPTQEAFAEFFKPQFAALISMATDAALHAAWYQKWFVHRTIRPEYYGFLVNQQITGVFDAGLHEDIINSQAVQFIFALNSVINGGMGTYFLPQAFPEGSPIHPTYPAGHATVAGACVTMLKAFFNEDFVIPNPVIPNAAGTALVAYTDGPLTVGGELNKLAANIAIARNMAGVHYRSDATQSLLLGEKMAISMLEDWAYTFNIPFNGFSLTKFDGTKITVGAKRTAPSI
jgi:hypothetical protein